MTARERGFLLLTGMLGDPDRQPLTVAQFRTLASRMDRAQRPAKEDRELNCEDLTALGYNRTMAQRIVALLAQEDLLDHYLMRGKKLGCVPITRVSEGYPVILRKRLGLDAPACIWARGDLNLLDSACIALVGSRDLLPENRRFAEEAGKQAARQGFTLVSGNARGADTEAQNACCGGVLANRNVTGDYSKIILPVGESHVSTDGDVSQVIISNYVRWY